MRTVTWSVPGGTPTTITISDTETPAGVRAAVQGALDAAAANGTLSAPATVTLSAGVFMIDGTDGTPSEGGVRVGSNTIFQGTLDGSGAKLTTIELDPTTTYQVTGIVRTDNEPGVHDATIKDMAIVGRGQPYTSDATSDDGIYVGHAPGVPHDPAVAHSNIVIDNVDVSETARYGIDPHEQTINLTITNSISHHNGRDGFTLDYIEGGLIENNTAHDNGRHGFNVVTGSYNLTLKDNTAYNNGDNGIVIQPPSDNSISSHHITIIGGEVYGNAKHGIEILSSQDITVEGVHIHDNMLGGVRVGLSSGAGAPPSSGILIAGNWIERNGTSTSDAEVRIAAGEARILGNVIGGPVNPDPLDNPYDLSAEPDVTWQVDGNKYVRIYADVDADAPPISDPNFALLLNFDDNPNTAAEGNRRQFMRGLGGDDTLSTGIDKDTLDGGDGDDSLFGEEDNDFLIGGAGADLLDGGSGADTMFGGEGDDTYVVDDIGDIVEEAFNASAAAGGTDTVVASIAWTLGAYVENLAIAGSGAVNGTGNALANALAGNDAVNILYGVGGTDTLDGGDGNDTLEGGVGADALIGGTGIDLAAYDSAAARVKVALDGSFAGESDSLGDSYNGIERVRGSAFGDVIRGDSGDNRLLGGSGNDTLQGRDGDDSVLGGNGADALTGGAGGDDFDYTATAHGGDTIHDFATGIDSMRFDDAAFGGLPTGALDSSRFTANTSGLATTADHRFIYETDAGILRYDSNGNASGGVVVIATFTGAPSMAFGDITII